MKLVELVKDLERENKGLRDRIRELEKERSGRTLTGLIDAQKAHIEELEKELLAKDLAYRLRIEELEANIAVLKGLQTENEALEERVQELEDELRKVSALGVKTVADQQRRIEELEARPTLSATGETPPNVTDNA